MRHLFPEFIRSMSTYQPIERSLNLDHLVDDVVRETYRKQGYVVIPGAAQEEDMQCIRQAYEQIRSMPDFYEAPGFITSPNYGLEVQQAAHDILRQATAGIFPRLFHMDAITYDLLNVLVIKFNNPGSELFPHQDVPIVDERTGSTTFTWVPTEDIDEHNGHLMAIPGSHIWGAWQRTHNQQFSPLQKHRRLLLRYMKPIFLKKGDVVLFDCALVHASAPNLSKKVRIAMNASVVSASAELIHYQTGNSAKRGYIEKYRIDRSFFENGHYLNPNNVPDRFHPPELEKLLCDIQINPRNLKKLIDTYNPI